MGGLTPFSIEPTEQFQRSLKKLYKSLAKGIDSKLKVEIEKILESLIDDQNPSYSRMEPFPSNLNLPVEWQFYKIVFSIGQGASGQIRLMYLVNSSLSLVRLLWIYNHAQFAKRPPDKDLKVAIHEILDP